MRAGLNYITPLATSVAAGAARVLGLREGSNVPLGVLITRCNAELQSQSAVDAAVELHDRV